VAYNLRNDIKEIATQFLGEEKLGQVVLAPDVPQTISIVSGSIKAPAVDYFHSDGEGTYVTYDAIQYLQKEYQGNTYLFAVNIATSAVTARFCNLPGTSTSAQVLFENNRSVSVTNTGCSRSLTDDFAVNAVHVYRLANPNASPSLTPTPPTCSRASSGDFNCDNLINESDLNTLLSKWMTNEKDITGDGKVDESDLNKLLSNWKTN